jgi:hypothetical protein
MRYCTKICLLILLVFYSCEPSRKEKAKAMDYLDLIENIGYSYKPARDQFINKMGASISKVKDDKNTIIDTRELDRLRIKALTTTSSTIKQLEEVKEIDGDIGYKQSIIDNLRDFESACDNEFKISIDIFDQRGIDRFKKVSALTVPKALKIKESTMKAADKRRIFIGTYTYQLETESNPDTVQRTLP